MTTEQQFEHTRQEIKARLDAAINAKGWATAEHWLAELRKMDDVECMLMAFAPEEVGG